MAFLTRTAEFYDESGVFHGSVNFGKADTYFTYSDGAYIVDIKNSSSKASNVIPGIWKRRTYTYNIDNPFPFRFDKKGEPIINPKLLKIHLETKVAQDLNDLPKKGFLSKLLTPRNIAIALALVVVIWYVSTHKVF